MLHRTFEVRMLRASLRPSKARMEDIRPEAFLGATLSRASPKTQLKEPHPSQDSNGEATVWRLKTDQNPLSQLPEFIFLILIYSIHRIPVKRSQPKQPT